MKRFQVYKCDICGNIVELIETGGGKLTCCGKEMRLLDEKTNDNGKEKHVPVIEKNIIKVGSIPHPMEKNHYIQWIEIIADGKVFKKFLKPGDKPEAELKIKAKDIIIRAYCNIHELWKSKQI